MKVTHDEVMGAHSDVIECEERIALARSANTKPSELQELLELHGAAVYEYQRLRAEYEQPSLLDEADDD